MTSAAAAVRSPFLRHLTRFRAGPSLAGACRHQQRRWAQVHDVVRVRFVATAGPSSSVLDKYRDKLDRKAREEGHGSIDALQKAYADKIEALRKEASLKVPSAEHADRLAGSGIPVETDDGDASAATATPSTTTSTTTDSDSSTSDTGVPPLPKRPKSGNGSGVKPLSAILDLSKARELPPTELGEIWRQYHASDPQSLCAVIPAATFGAMEAAARNVSASFVHPMPHPEQGCEMHFLQWTWDAPSRTATVLFTQLAEYKLRGEFAQPHTTVTHHLDLREDKGLVLMQGQVVEGRGVSPDQARWLVMCLQRFYGAWEEGERAAGRRKLLEWFAKGDARFSVEKLMDEAERMG